MDAQIRETAPASDVQMDDPGISYRPPVPYQQSPPSETALSEDSAILRAGYFTFDQGSGSLTALVTQPHVTVVHTPSKDFHQQEEVSSPRLNPPAPQGRVVTSPNIVPSAIVDSEIPSTRPSASNEGTMHRLGSSSKYIHSHLLNFQQLSSSRQ